MVEVGKRCKRNSFQLNLELKYIKKPMLNNYFQQYHKHKYAACYIFITLSIFLEQPFWWYCTLINA